jgi:hypothetical protein
VCKAALIGELLSQKPAISVERCLASEKGHQQPEIVQSLCVIESSTLKMGVADSDMSVILSRPTISPHEITGVRPDTPLVECDSRVQRTDTCVYQDGIHHSVGTSPAACYIARDALAGDCQMSFPSCPSCLSRRSGGRCVTALQSLISDDL